MTTTTETLLTPSQAEALDTNAVDQARAQYRSICEMVAALNVDYDRLAELRDLEDGKHLDAVELDELAELEQEAGECTDADDARERIQEDALDVQMRSGWTSDIKELICPEEFRILLCTGGPAVQIRGELHYGQPVRAWLEYQDWGTPWTQYFDAAQDTLLAYASCFYFGE